MLYFRWPLPGTSVRIDAGALPTNLIQSSPMDELINVVVQRTGLSQEQASQAVTAVIGFLKTKLPAPIAAHLDGILAGGASGGLGGLETQAGEMLKGKLGGMFGGSGS